jgi:hypothetical protein
MTPQDDEIAKKITTYLDHGTAELKAGTVYRLQQARAAAMARLAEPATASAGQSVLAGARTLAGAGGEGGVGSSGRPFYAQLWFWLGVAVLAAAAYGFQQWEVVQQARELAEIDSQILSSDLPIDAYLDRGFQNWIKTGFDE